MPSIAGKGRKPRKRGERCKAKDRPLERSMPPPGPHVHLCSPLSFSPPRTADFTVYTLGGLLCWYCPAPSLSLPSYITPGGLRRGGSTGQAPRLRLAFPCGGFGAKRT